MPFTTATPPQPFSFLTTGALSGTTQTGLAGAVFTAGVILPSNPGRKGFFVQVVGTGGPLYLNYSATTPDVNNWHRVLAAATTMNGTNGGVLEEDKWQGPVACSGAAFVTFKVWEAL